MKHIARIFLSLAAFAVAICAWGQSKGNIVNAINQANGSVVIIQAEALNAISAHADIKPATSNMGYRIQVFSDNDMRSAKSNADYRKRAIEQQFPQYRAYVTFESPYWRVRVGDFRSSSQANAALREIKSAFPAFANDARIVREKINTAQ